MGSRRWSHDPALVSLAAVLAGSAGVCVFGLDVDHELQVNLFGGVDARSPQNLQCSNWER